MTPTPKNLNASLVSNNVEGLSEIQNKIKEQAKLQVFESLDFDKRSLSDINSTISEIKEIEKDGKKAIDGLGATKIKYETLKKNYNSIFEKYKDAGKDEKELMYMELAERVILNRWGTISYKDGESIGKQTINKDFVKNEYNVLNTEYDNKLDLFTVKDKDGKLYIIRRKADELRLIKEKEEELKNEEIERLWKENKGLNKLDAENKNDEDGDERGTNDKTMELLIKKLMEDSEKKDKEIEKRDAKISELEELIKNNGEKIDDTKEEREAGDEEKADNEETDVAGPQIVITEEDEEEVDEEEVDEDKEANEENSNFISRKSVETSILKLRKTLGYPAGIIEIREEKINIEEFEFYEEIKLKYIEAQGDEVKLSELDKEFAELVILFSPVGSDVKDRYTIKLTEEEMDRGLYVSEEFLARYGLRINIHNYYEKIVEREYKERVEIVEKIETEIQTLSTTIIELTSKINIEGTSSEEILHQIKIKRKRIIMLKERLAKLLLSLKSGNGKLDNELLALKKRLEEVEKELSELREQKKHQDEVNQRVADLEKEIYTLENHKANKSKIRKQVEKEFFNKIPIANRNQFADSISKNRNDNGLNGKNIGIPGGNVKITANPLREVNIDLDLYGMRSKYEDLVNEIHDLRENYKGNKNRIGEAEKKLRELDSMLAERITLDNGLAIEFKTSDEKNFESKRNAKDERDYAYKKLNELPQYKGKLRRGYAEKNGEKYYYIFIVTDQQKANIEKEVEKRLKAMQNGDNSEKLKALKDELKKLKEEQAGFDEDIDQKIADKEKELADLQNKIKEKEKNNKKRIVVETFDDGDFGVGFAKYCEENGIKRKDGKEIPWKGGMDTSAIYIDGDGRELKLERKTGANDDGYDNPVTHYELVYYEESGEGELSEVEIQLEALIHEQEILLKELEELEEKLVIAISKKEKINIEKKIRIINKKLTVIKQKITKFKTVIRSYKQTITVRRYRVYTVTPMIPTPIPANGLQLNAVISDMGTDVFREKAALKVEEQIKQQYKSLGRWQMGSRLALFLGRGRRRKKMMQNEMNGMANTAFQTDPNYVALNEQSQNAADRHGHELLTNMAAVNRITTVNNQQIDQLCKAYLNGGVSDTQFQQNFNTIVASDTNIQNALANNNITHIGTNILLQLKEQRALNVLINTLDGQLAQYIATGNNVYINNMQNYVEQYIKDYQKLPAFKATFEQFLSNPNTHKSLEKALNNQKAIMKMQLTNLRMNIDILNKGKSAYQIDNKDREKGWKYKLGHFLDKHPWGTAIGSAALAIGLGFATAGTSAVVGAAVSTGVFGSYVGFTNYIKKWTHHTKEQNTHEKNVVTDYRNEQARIQTWQNEALNGHGWRKYKAKRQLALYDETTQANIQLSNQITEYITNLSAKTGTLTSNEDNFMRLNLIEGWARLQYYRQMGHNFLASENVDQTEKDMKRLEKAITLGLQKIGRTTNDIQTTMTATNTLGANITYAVIQNDLKASYDKSLIQFKRERKNLALKYGIGTAVASIGASLAFQYAFGSGVFGRDTPAFSNTVNTSDNFNLGQANGLSSSISSDTNSFLSSVPNGSNITIHYGAGTDATPVIPGHLGPSSLSSKISSVNSYISGLPTKTAGAAGPGLTAADKASFLAEVSGLSGGTGTNGILQNMRHADALKQLAEGLSTSGKSGFNTITLTPDSTLDVVGLTTYTPADRVANVFIEAAKDGVKGKKCRFFGVPLFFNTFKDRKASKDTTDQKFGK